MTDKIKKKNSLYKCAVIHESVLEKVQSKMTNNKTLVRMAELFKAMSDPTRLKIINAILLSEMCVCDIASLLNMSQPAISHHLKVLRQTRLIKYRRDGKVVYYSLDDNHVGLLFKKALEHATEN